MTSLEAVLNSLAPRWRRQQVARLFWDFDKAKLAETDCRFTPPEFLNSVVECFGPLGLDPCWHQESSVKASRTIALPECGLSSDWTTDETVFVNPPFGDLANWIAKVNREWATGTVKKLLLLFPASRLDIREFFDRTARHGTTLILRDRLRFSRLGHKGYPSPFALALTCLGCSEEELARFMTRYPALVIPPRDRCNMGPEEGGC